MKQLRQALQALAIAGAIALVSTTPGTVDAQTYPAKPIVLVVPYGPGGGVDIVARSVQQSLSKLLGQTVIVENRAGAGGAIAAAYVARAAPDGYTLFVTDVGPSTVLPTMDPNLPYKVGKDLIPVGMIASSSLDIAINPSLNVDSVASLIAYAKAHPGALNFSSPGNGTIVHMAAELFKLMTQTDMVHVPYKSGAEAVTALLGGQVQLSFAQIPLTVPLAAAGKLKILGVSSAARSPLIPNVPTISEAGVVGYEVTSWIGILAPAGTPKDIMATLEKAFYNAVTDPKVSAGLQDKGFDVTTKSGEEFGTFIASETKKWAQVVKANHLKPE